MSVTHFCDPCNRSHKTHCTKLGTCNAIKEQKLFLYAGFENIQRTADYTDQVLIADRLRRSARLTVRDFDRIWFNWLDERDPIERHLDRLPIGVDAILLGTNYTFKVTKRVRDEGQIYICGGDQPYKLEDVDRVTVGGASHV